MRLWKQLLICLVILVAALGVWVHFVPGADAMLAKAGVPQQVIALVAKPAGEAKDGGQGQGSGQGRRNQGGGGGATLVVTQPVDVAVVNDRLNAIGNGAAILSVSVTPQATGNLTEVLAKSGDRIEKGQVIARLDSDEQAIAADQAKVAVESAKEKVERNRKLGNAVSVAVLRDAEFAMQAAELALKTAELDLKRRDIVSPSAGIVGIITVNPGDYVTTSTPIAVVDDRSQILVDFWVPERFSNKISVGQDVSATAIALPTSELSGVIDAIDNRVDQESRTLRVRARIENPDDTLRAGMSFSVSVRFAGDQYPTVNPLAVQWSADGSYVWRVQEEKSQRVPVKIIQRNSDKVLVDAELAKGDAVVMEGVQRLRDGGAVRLAEQQQERRNGKKPAEAQPAEQKVSEAETAK
ncbi:MULTISPECIES: efflux RND transporter periplasmic adaptor subunit [unclassified Rhizobium]|uniref:efflux RND transporter periplasmic adaptor subunit n=1 Tax=unclassified Rhizobium TaxID=2613769 RepID=UPI000714D940|nr:MULTISPECIES: efflux RND transporter periplasmic adaptor subunit [unclassified Rhizobium]KQS97917.1 secretion protein HylD [Rhizobium sp. Leaf386]KQT00175.1 secretion protein HylD [Rhizobium sp. Leaf391]KQT97180.1 secretion protein HylD [Rhizobium sp. Leaf453]